MKAYFVEIEGFGFKQILAPNIIEAVKTLSENIGEDVEKFVMIQEIPIEERIED